jgi:hypothetical protein
MERAMRLYLLSLMFLVLSASFLGCASFERSPTPVPDKTVSFGASFETEPELAGTGTGPTSSPPTKSLITPLYLGYVIPGGIRLAATAFLANAPLGGAQASVQFPVYNTEDVYTSVILEAGLYGASHSSPFKKENFVADDNFHFASEARRTATLTFVVGAPLSGWTIYAGPEMRYLHSSASYEKRTAVDVTETQDYEFIGSLFGALAGVSGRIYEFERFSLHGDAGARYHQFPNSLKDKSISFRTDAYIALVVRLN